MTAACAHVCHSYHQAITNNKYRIPRLTNHDKTKKNGNSENLNNANLLFVKKFGGLNIRRIRVGEGESKKCVRFCVFLARVAAYLLTSACAYTWSTTCEDLASRLPEDWT